jgi:hypothetical protein
MAWHGVLWGDYRRFSGEITAAASHGHVEFQRTCDGERQASVDLRLAPSKHASAAREIKARVLRLLTHALTAPSSLLIDDRVSIGELCIQPHEPSQQLVALAIV